MMTPACSLSGQSPISSAIQGLSSDSFELLALIASFGSHMIPDLLFLRFRGEQKRWTIHGEIGVLTPSEAGFDPIIQRILSPLHFPALMDELAPWVRQVTALGNSNDVYYTIISPLKEQLTHLIDNDQRRKILAIRLVCFVFPHERLWEPQ